MKRYIFDMHVHTSRYSYCSNLLPEDLIESAKAKGLDGVVITEHGSIWPKKEIGELNDISGKEGPLFLTGQEVRTEGSDGREADVLIYGMNEPIGKYLPADELLKVVNCEGAVAVAAHPRRNILGLRDDIYLYGFHGVETLNSNYGREEILISINDMKNLDCAFIAGSDAHSVRRIGRYVTVFSTTINNMDDIVRAIKEKKCAPAGGFITESETEILLEENNVKTLKIKKAIL